MYCPFSETRGAEENEEKAVHQRGFSILFIFFILFDFLNLLRGAEVYSGKDTIKLTYTDAYIKCTVNEKTGTITGGTWHYKVKVFVGAAELKLGIKINVKNLKAVIDYTVVI